MEELVSIVILNWNGLKDTKECLESLKDIDYPNCEIIVVDNGSTDGSCEFLKANFPYVRLIENETNLGVPEGNNCGIREARGKYVLLLNNDVVVDRYFLKELVNVAESDPQVGAVGAAVYYYDDPGTIWVAGAMISWNSGGIRIVGRDEVDEGQFNEVTEVDYVPSCSMLVRRELFERVGYFDPKYFVYYDETDWCIRAQRAGNKVMCNTKAKIWHKVSATSGKEGSQFSIYFRTRNRFRFMKKLAGRKQLLSFLLWFFACAFWFNLGMHLFYNRDVKALAPFCRGVRDGLLNSEAGAKLYTKG